VVETVRVEDAEPLADNVMLVGLRETPGPLGEIVTVRATVAVKPLRLVRVTVADPDELWATVSIVGLDVALKSGPPFVEERTTMLPNMCCRWIEQ